MKIPSSAAFNDLKTFADVKKALEKVVTLGELSSLNDAVEARFICDQQKLYMSGDDWRGWTMLVREKAALID